MTAIEELYTLLDNLEQEIREKDEKIQELKYEIVDLKNACDDYENLMQECIFDQ